jgi:hypothetical protein
MKFIDDNPDTRLVCDRSSMLEDCVTGDPSVIICDRCGCDFHFDCLGLSAVRDGDYICNLCSLPHPPLTLELEECVIADIRAPDRTYRTPFQTEIYFSSGGLTVIARPRPALPRHASRKPFPLHTMRLLNALTK